MQTQSNGLFSTVLLLAALVAVPFLAVVGVPRPEEPADADDDLAAVAAFADVEQPGVGESAHPRVDDLFAPLPDAGLAAKPQAEAARATANSQDDQTPLRHAAATGWQQERERPDAFSEFDRQEPSVSGSPAALSEPASSITRTVDGAAFSSPEHASPGNPMPRPPAISWHAAVRRLNTFGIRDFALSPGADDASFLFVCALPPSAGGSVTRRFEAQAPEPLAAVDDVLEQVESWMAGQEAVASSGGARVARASVALPGEE